MATDLSLSQGLLLTHSYRTGLHRAEGTRDGGYRTVYAKSRDEVIRKWHSAAPNEWARPKAGQTLDNE
ncbi:hypothetical protein HNP46_006068 [Pseudomonas nitritireducens]|uniref:Uncharacterized protein n=1 Tax=Pseudomonas nitroreducens TaxID=46680 RepID=A0A7W7P5C3_PSENT|nr:hypothetical protein [Pseudomonas nitritireducens]MBB4867157.1 hypothetical protein [Pseudomonas nitritireducens]